MRGGSGGGEWWEQRRTWQERMCCSIYDDSRAKGHCHIDDILARVRRSIKDNIKSEHTRDIKHNIKTSHTASSSVTDSAQHESIKRGARRRLTKIHDSML